MGQATAGQLLYRKPAQEHDHPLKEMREPLLAIQREDPVDNNLLYHNLVEMIPFAPLVETLMQDQQTTKSFPRHASLVYTPTPPRETWPFKKAVDHSSKGKPGRGQLLSGKRSELRESSLWDNAENMLHDDQNLFAEDIPMIPYPPNQRANRAAAPSSETSQLRRQVQQLEQRLSEKECQLQVVEKTAQQLHLQLNATVERLQSQIQQKDQAIQNVQNQLFERQLEVVSLQSLVKKSEVNVQASSMKAASLEEELDGLRSQVGALLFLVQSQISGFVDVPIQEASPVNEEPPAIEGSVSNEPISPTTCDIPTMTDMQADSPQVDDLDEQHIEVIRQKYVAALIAARENPSDEMLSLVADLRMQLHALVMCPIITDCAIKDEMCWQPLGISIC